MGTDLVAYIEQLELMAFFAGYPLIYTLVHVITSGKKANATASPELVKLLPFAYALSGTLFTGLLIRNIYPDYSLHNIAAQFQYPYLRIFGLLSLLCWLPHFSRKPIFSLLHSLVFFLFIVKDLFDQITAPAGKEMIKNDMKIYTDSLLLNTGTIIIVVLAFYFFRKIIKSTGKFQKN
jgi:hypothetical protein